jgi:hypothetical protein
VLRIGKDWIIYFDAYREGIYGAAKTRDFKSFQNITDKVHFPTGHKHGTALRVPRSRVHERIAGSRPASAAQ